MSPTVVPITFGDPCRPAGIALTRTWRGPGGDVGDRADADTPGLAILEPELITLSVERRDEIGVLAVGGVMDTLTGAVLRRAINDIIGEGVVKIIIDLSAVKFMSSVGLSLLFRTAERVGDDIGGLAVVTNGPATRKPIQLTGLDRFFALYPTLDQALAAAHHPAGDSAADGWLKSPAADRAIGRWT